MKLHYPAVIALCLLWSCGSNQDANKGAEQSHAVQTDWTWTHSNAEQFWAAWKPADGPVEMGPSFAIECLLAAEKAGTPLDLPVDRIDIQARMPEHQHGMLQSPVITRLGPGHYRVEGMRFHMLGYWQLSIDVTRPPLSERAQFDIRL